MTYVVSVVKMSFFSFAFSSDSTWGGTSSAFTSQRPARPCDAMLSFESFRFTGRVSTSPGKRPGDSPVTPSPKRAAGGRIGVVVAAKSAEDPCADAPPLEVRREAFVAPAPARWRERYAPACAACEAARTPCAHTRERPLKLLVCGHNPSDHSWMSGFSYSNPSNNFWRLLVTGEIIPKDWTAEDCPRLQRELGIGFTDAGTVPGNDAAKYDRKTMLAWRADLYARLRGHLCRVAAAERASDSRQSPGDSPGEQTRPSWLPSSSSSFTVEASARAAERGYGPAVVAFAGKRQYGQLFDRVPKRIETGKQEPDALPPGWPFRAKGEGATEVWVLPSSSGRAAMTKEAREGPYVELGKKLRGVAWPRTDHETRRERTT